MAIAFPPLLFKVFGLILGVRIAFDHLELLSGESPGIVLFTLLGIPF